MKRLIITARNYHHSINGDEVLTDIEAILTTTIKEHRVRASGLGTEDKLETIRIAMSPASARDFSKALVEWADEAEAEAKRLTLTMEPDLLAEIQKSLQDDDLVD